MKLKDILEPTALLGLTSRDPVDTAAMLSIAVSLKRIADHLQPVQHTNHADRYDYSRS